MRLPPMMLLACALSACAPTAEVPTEADARAAMTARMQASKSAKVVVTELRELSLSGCTPAPSLPGVVCDVRMDVVYTLDGAPQRSDDRARMRFVREPEGWRAYPL
ncbi:hypothetical protein [Arenimonas sp. MALMAid1274]|uniref:hypothetical protein n=1 Tax=Arenimonas sp. MALMAid1274 TaxID=3411630 RepID=UPI003BA2FA7A